MRPSSRPSQRVPSSGSRRSASPTNSRRGTSVHRSFPRAQLAQVLPRLVGPSGLIVDLEILRPGVTRFRAGEPFERVSAVEPGFSQGWIRLYGAIRGGERFREVLKLV